MAFFHSTKY